MRKSENLCNLGKNSTIISNGSISIRNTSEIISSSCSINKNNNNNNNNNTKSWKSSPTSTSKTTTSVKIINNKREPLGNESILNSGKESETIGSSRRIHTEGNITSSSDNITIKISNDNSSSSIQRDEQEEKTATDIVVDDRSNSDHVLDLILAHELAKALRAEDHERFIEIYDFYVPNHFDRDRVSATLFFI